MPQDRRSRHGRHLPGVLSDTATFSNPEADTFVLELHNAPYDDALRKLIEDEEGQFRVNAVGAIITITLCKKDAPFLRKLAKAVRRIIGRGHRYDNANWRWLCPRTAASLERLAGHLADFRRAAIPIKRS